MKNRNNIYTTTLVALCVCACARRSRRSRILEGGPLLPLRATRTSAESPIITIHSTDNVTRGKDQVHSYWRCRPALDTTPALRFGGRYVNFKVSGTAIAGVDYVLLVSPARIGQSGYGVIQVKTLPDLRGSSFRQAYSVVVTLEPGPGYEVGAASSATMWIKP